MPKEEEVLARLDPNYRALNAAQLSDLISKGLRGEELALFQKTYRDKMPLSQRAEECMREGRLRQALELLNHSLLKGNFGNEYLLGLLGDVYAKMGDLARAEEFYLRSGSIDSLKKARNLK